ncbi:putative disease resistance protein At4g11170 isoform X2 [Vigna radiata var. radiata]|uniref:Disease resistance protein At4g11170 isoform X2 n=1 Tax=Vigna radiata var. radiata TaxID=3916 RepID=A0A3Q0FDD6_VIGRR|nr:putative disease resistance protein At4g11170 isoform X2 [Vigna radiata var. radiata]
MESLEMSSTFGEKHDVFLSFRGADTRTNFTSHLLNALTQKSISAFIDYELIRGDYTWPALETAIEKSLLSIVVLSENYASSTWCLKELAHILECRRKRGMVVIPVFYEVDPSHVRKLSGSFEKSFAKHERDSTSFDRISQRKDVSMWKAALKEVANISGWDSRSYRDEAQVIQNLVNDVLQKLHLRYPTELNGLVRIKNTCAKVDLLLRKSRVIGIWGMGGIGKSTIAKALFAKYFPYFDHVCFMANANEFSLDKLFSELFREEVSASNVVGSSFDMRRLKRKRIFIVLDDMDCLDLLEYLCREYQSLDPNSKLIITTRDKQLLEGRVDQIYEVKKWETRASLKLFCLEAFKKRHPKRGYESLSESAVEYAGGVPLALKVLGSYLRSKGINFWESTIRKLSMYPNERIQKVLEVTYTGLHDLEKNIFLDIVFFFKEKQKDHVITILDACGFEATSGIEILADKALLTISYRKIIHMHDLLQQMGLEIVRQESSGDPGRRSRLKDKEAREVIEENKGTSAIQGIALDLSQIKGLILHADTFTKMKTLRFLKFYNKLGQSARDTYLDLPATLEPFSDKLRYIEWIGYPFESLPSPFCAKVLVEIHMPHSKVKQLWQGIQELNYLEGINLRQCKQFEELPDLSKAPRLKWVNLSCCESLCYLHPSVLSSGTLVTLILDKCTNLKSVKSEKDLKSLEKISVNGCLNLVEFAVSSDLIENLDLSNTGIQMLGTSIGSMHKLKSLNLEGLKLKPVLKELSCLTSLKVLKISDNGLVIDKQQIHVLFSGLRYLQILYLKDCSKLFELPDNINLLTQLQELRLDRSDLKRLPENIKNLQMLEILSLEDCKELLCLPTFPSLIKYLRVINCTSLVSVSNLKTLAIEMLGMTKRITFKNSGKLDEDSLRIIMESLHLTMMSAAYHNVLVRKTYGTYNSCNYTSVELCLPGGSVPEQIHYRSTQSSITIVLPPHSELLGFIYSVVLSPAGGKKTFGTKIFCKCHLPEEGIKATWLYGDIRGLKSDHVYVWYDPLHCDSILKYYKQSKVCFEFCVANDKGEVDGSICIKECGVGLVNVLEMHSVLQELDFDSDKKKELVEGVESESKHRKLDWSESSSSDSLTTPRSSSVTQSEIVEMIELENTESTCKETLSTAERGPKEKLRESTKIVADEHLQSTSLQASSQGGSEHLHDRLEESKKQVVETYDTEKFVTKYSYFDLESCLQQLDENPFAILDLLSNELSPLKQSETCVQRVAQANDATTVLNEFRTLVFSTSLLEKLPDQSYRQQIEESLRKLHTYRREITEEQEGVDKFIELYEKAANISQEKMLTEDKQTKLASKKRDLYNKLQDSKLKVQQFDTAISTDKSEIENLQKRQREIQEAINKLQQENEALEKERSALEVLYSGKQTKKNETLELVKHISTSVVYTTKQLEELEEKRLSLASAYEDLKEPYGTMKTKPPF